MTYEFEYLMHLFACGSKGLTPQPPRQSVDFDRLIQLAQEQSVLPLVGTALSKTSDIGFPSEKVTALVNITRKQALSNYVKRRQIFKLLQDFEKAGIQAVLLKGYAVADMYAEPDCRISADTDIYVNIKDEKQSYKLLREHGFKVNPRSHLSHHAVCEHPQMGHIELHAILYAKIVEDVWFEKTNDQQFICEAYERHESEDGSFYTLGKTDNLIFIVLHMIKHFIFCGTSLRQMMDIALYLNTYKNQINFKRFWEMLESLRYQKLMNTVLSVLVSYCGFLSNNLFGFVKVDDTAISALLEDLETGGWLGTNESDKRKSAWYKYNRIKFTEKGTSVSYWFYMAKRNIIYYFLSIFPPLSSLKKKYPYAVKIIWFVPIAWTQHLLTGFLKLLNGKLGTGIVNNKNRILEDKKDRVQLFKVMQIM